MKKSDVMMDCVDIEHQQEGHSKAFSNDDAIIA